MKLDAWESFLVWFNSVLKKRLRFGLIRAGGEFEVARETVICRGNCSVVVDGGANSGQWSRRLRKRFPLVTICSFEPLLAPFEKLEKGRKSDPNWIIHREALGDSKKSCFMNVASNEGQSSSLKNPTSHLTNFESVHFNGKENVRIVRLDEHSELYGETIFLKLDVQGSEWEAIIGCDKLLNNIIAIEVETSFTSMYESDLTHYELIPKIISLGYVPFAVSPPHRNHDGRCTYMDVILVRPEFLSERT